MSDALEILAIGFATAMVFSLPFIFVAFLRYMRYKERVALARSGVAPAAPSPAPIGRTSSLLRWGILIAAIGLALSCSLFTGLVFTVWSSWGGPELILIITPLAFLVLLPLFFGGALLFIYWLNGRAAAPDDEPIPPGKVG